MIYFDNLQTYTFNYTLDIAEAVAAAMNVAGIHECSYHGKEWNIADEETIGVFSRSGNTVSASGAGVLDLFQAGGNLVVDVSMQTNCIVGTGVGVDPYRSSLIRVRITNSHIEILGDTASVLARFDKPSDMTKMRIAFWEVTNYKLEVTYKIVGVYHGDLLVAAYAVQTDNMESATSFYIETPGAATFTVYASDFSNIALVASVDPGEAVSSGLSRLILGVPIELFARFDGNVYYYAPSTRTVLYSLDDYIKYAQGISRAKEYRQLSGVIRSVSALPEAEYMHPDSVDKVGAQFKVAQNPNVTTFEGAALDAERTQRKTRQAFKTLRIQGAFMPLAEPGDVFSVLGDNWIHDSSDMTIGTEGRFDGRISANQYQPPE